MGKITGGLAGLAIWLGATAVAEAQGGNVTTTGPTCIFHNTSTFYVTGTLSGQSSYDYKITIVVNGITRVDHKAFYTTGSTINKGFNASTWSLAANQPFVTTIDLQPQGTSSSTLSITVTQGITYLIPSKLKPSTAPAALKEEQLAWESAAPEEIAA